MIDCNLGMSYFNKIVDTGVPEMRIYQSLPKERQLEIISLFWTNLVKFFLLERLEGSKWKLVTEKDKNEKNFFYNIKNAIFMKGKGKKEKDYLAISVSYDENICAAQINYFVISQDETREEKLKSDLKKDLLSIEEFLSKKLTKKIVLKYCFETLYCQRLCNTRGNDAVIMYHIMCRAVKHYPKFAKLSKGKKIKVIRTGYINGMKVPAKYRDVYTFSKATFEALESSGLADIVYKFNPIISRYSTYVRWGQSPYLLPGSTCPRFINYAVETQTGATYRTSFLSFDLWEILAKPC